VASRRGFADQIWLLAQAGDVAALEQAGELLLREPVTLEYEGHRALAFARAIRGDAEGALAELNDGWIEEWPFPAAFAADRGRIQFLVGDVRGSLEALRLAARGAKRNDPSTIELAAACVSRRRASVFRALRVAVSGGTPWQRVRAAAGIGGALFRTA
jgi:hypothetical protein